MTGSGQSQEEATAMIMGAVSTKTTPLIGFWNVGKAKEGWSEDHMAADGGERNATDGKDLEQHFSHGERPAEVEGPRCCPTSHPA